MVLNRFQFICWLGPTRPPIAFEKISHQKGQPAVVYGARGGLNERFWKEQELLSKVEEFLEVYCNL